MEKFFTVKEDSKLYTDYFEHEESQKKAVELYHEFAKEVGIECTGFVPSNYRLIIKPTENDLVNFKEFFFKKCFDNGLKEFRKSSPICKKWIETVKSARILSKPMLCCYGFMFSGRCSERLFSIGKKVYGSYETNYDFELPTIVTGIPASQFYKDVEDYNNSLDEHHGE